MQLHGRESVSYCRALVKKFKVIKVFFPQDRPFKGKVSRYPVDAVMFDVLFEDKKTKTKTLSPAALQEVKALIFRGKPVIISGGLKEDNLSRVKKLAPYAIDVASGVERSPGKKDKVKMKRFIKKAKS